MYVEVGFLKWLANFFSAQKGWYTKDRPNKNLDVVVVEATDIKEDGSIVLGASVGATPELIQMADKVKLENSMYLGRARQRQGAPSC